ncbi:Fantastic Four meristem regulator [Carex littledalei]|uniref:Fantastic Four meristem regulator n=1 Tax=Carex littledalei TaxID=544730 RepID=A0A833RLX2_9POAL|nr:Fantastic Four meristem regulator [Carex littledalei]
MLVIRKCLFGSSKGAGDDKHKYYDIASFPDKDFPLISTDTLHAPPEEAHLEPISETENGEESEIESHTELETLAEEPLPAETQVEEPPSDETPKAPQPEETLVEEPELQDLSALFGLREPDRSSLYTCTEILGSEICDNMVKDMSEAVTEWSWNRKRQKQKAIDVEMLANRGFPPPIPRYIGRPCQFMNIERCNGRITMSLVQMDRQPELMQIEREDGQVKMQLMTYVGDARNNDDDAEASTLASTSQQVVETTSEEEELVTDKWDSGGKPQKKCLALAA